MELTPEQLVTLKTELETDPKGLNYAAIIDNMALGKHDRNLQIAVLLNEAGRSGETINVDSVPVKNIVAAIDTTEYAGLSVDQRTLLQSFLGASHFEIGAAGDNIRAIIEANFRSNAPNTADAFIALTQRPASRAEILFGERAKVIYWYVGRVLDAE